MANKTIIPEEYVRQNKEFDETAYVQKRINDAVKKSYERESGVDQPSWWDVKKNGDFENCIGTVTDNYGRPCYGNIIFEKDHAKYGFRKLNDDEETQVGDIFQLKEENGRPYHSMMYVGQDDYDQNIFNYGAGGYYDNDTGRFVSLYRKDGEYRYDNIPTRYRYVGLPDELEQIRKHNANVKNNTELLNLSKQHADNVFSSHKVEPVGKEDTIKFLENIVKKQRQ